jgi:hypothetical protein
MLFQNRRELVTHWQAEKAFCGRHINHNFSYSSPLDGVPSLSVQRVAYRRPYFQIIGRRNVVFACTLKFLSMKQPGSSEEVGEALPECDQTFGTLRLIA